MDVDHEARRLAADLAARHPLFRPQTVERLVRRIFDEFADSPVRTYLPVLVQREAERRLGDLDHDFPTRRRRAPQDGAGIEHAFPTGDLPGCGTPTTPTTATAQDPPPF